MSAFELIAPPPDVTSENPRSFSWWCPDCRRASHFTYSGPTPLYPLEWLLAIYTPDLHAMHFLADREDAEPLCMGERLEIAETFPGLDAILAEANAQT